MLDGNRDKQETIAVLVRQWQWRGRSLAARTGIKDVAQWQRGAIRPVQRAKSCNSNLVDRVMACGNRETKIRMNRDN